MANTTSRKIIEYVADTSDVLRKLGRITQANQKMARNLGQDFTKSFKAIDQGIGKISKTEIFDSEGIKKSSSAVEKFSQTIKTADGSLAKYSETTKTTSKGTKSVTRSFGEMDKNTVSLAQNMTRLAKRAALTIPLWLLLRGAMMGTLKIIKSSIKFMIDWEFQMAQMRIVGNESVSTLNTLSASMLNLATSLGISNSQLGESAKLFIQQGRSASELIPLLDATGKLSLLTGRTMVQSVEDLTAILKAYQIEAKSAINVVDLITNVMLNNAITADDLSRAYKQVASTASVMGVSLSQLTGFITAIKAETRDAGGKIGLSLRTMFTRITTVSAKSIQTLTKIPLFLDETGKKTKTATQSFRNLGNVLADLSLWYQSAGDADQVRLAKMVGGVRRTNQAIVLFKNYTQVIESQTDALLGLGKADEAVAILTDTTKLRITSLTNAWGEFIDSVGNTGAIKSSLDFLKIQIQGLTALIDPDQAFFSALSASLRDAGNEAQRLIQHTKNFQEILSLSENLSVQLGLAETTGEFELIQDRVDIIYNQIQSFNKLNPELTIDLKPNLDANEMRDSLRKLTDKKLTTRIDAEISFNRSQLQTELITLGKDFQDIFTKNVGELNLTTSTTKVFKQYKEIEKISNKLAQGQFITDSEITAVVEWAKYVKLTNEELVGVERNINRIGKTQKSLINLESTRLDVRKQITREQNREIKKLLTSEQVSRDLYDVELLSIRENKTKTQLLKAQLSILEREDQVLTTILDNKLKNIRKELEKINAQQEQQIISTLIDDNLKRFSSEGAINSEIIQRKLMLEDQFGVSRTISENLSRQLELERAINNEKRVGGNLSSDSLKLAQIGQDKENGGVRVASQIGRLLEGDIGIDAFKLIYKKAFDVFKEKFPAKFDQISAEKFLTKGLGQRIPIKEQALRSKPISTLNETQKAETTNSTLTQFTLSKNQLLPTQIDVEINTKLDANSFDAFFDRAVAEFSRKLRTSGTEINDSLNEGIDHPKLRRDL